MTRMSEAIHNLYVELRGFENAMNDLFKFCSVDVEEPIRCYNLNIRKKISCFLFRIGNSLFNFSASDAYLVQDLSVFRDNGMIRLASKHIDRTAR